MKYKLSWTQAALEDLASIRNYLHQESRLVAKKESEKIQKGIEYLKDFPRSGKLSSLLLKELRELVISSYRVFYRVEQQQIQILRVLHGKRNVDAILK